MSVNKILMEITTEIFFMGLLFVIFHAGLKAPIWFTMGYILLYVQVYYTRKELKDLIK